MSRMSRITWDPIFSVHVDILDEQHKQLFSTVNRLIDTFESGSDDFLPVINELIHYLSVHFHQENMVMMKANYPGFAAHSKEHEKFTEKVDGFLRDYKEGNQDLGLNMVVFMRKWIREHTTKMDIQYAEYLLKNADKLKQATN